MANLVQPTPQKQEAALAVMDHQDNLPALPGVFSHVTSFRQALEIAEMLSRSTMVPKQYQGQQGAPNVLVALELGLRMDLSPFTVMQNLDIITDGKPSWKSKFLIAQVNASGKYRGSLHYQYEELGVKKVPYEYWTKDQSGKSSKQTGTIEIENRRCRAWAEEVATGERIEGPWVSIELAVKEGWYTKPGSKWKTMPDMMLMYRAVSFFVSVHCPEVSIGLPTAEETSDIIDVPPARPHVAGPTLAEPQETAPANDNAGKQRGRKKADQGESERLPEQSAAQETSPTVEKFKQEIDAAIQGGADAVDQWRAKHHNRVARELGGTVDSPGYREVMAYAEMIYSKMTDTKADESVDQETGEVFDMPPDESPPQSQSEPPGDDQDDHDGPF